MSGNAGVAIFGDQMLGISKDGMLRDENNDFLTLDGWNSCRLNIC